MAEHSAIEWTDATVNFWWGCTKVGPGCDHCYAETLSNRFGPRHWGSGAPRRKIKGARALIHKLDNDYAWWSADAVIGGYHPNSRRRVFIQSMSDLFDNEVPLEWFDEAWGRIEVCNRIDIQIVTKRVSIVEKRLAAIGRSTWPRHAGLIVTVVNQDEADRDIPRLVALMQKFDIPWIGLSCEPLLGRIELPGAFLALGNRAWVIAGGESGPKARPAHPDWFRNLRDQCAGAGVPFLFKQWGEWAPGECATHRQTSTERVATFYDEDWTNPGWHFEEVSRRASEEMHLDDEPDLWRMGKKRAGRWLDGVKHDGFPVTP
jgi:protein gp37